MKIIRGIVAAIVFLVYTLLVHHVNATGQVSSLGAGLALLPIFSIVLAIAYKSHPAKALLLVSGSALAGWWLWAFIMQNSRYIFWLLDIGLMAVLLLTFARTLARGHTPLCVKFAEIINQGPLPLAHEVYARQVTIAWVIFFGMIIVVSTVLFFLAPLSVWSFFVNFLTLPLVGLMFVVEYLVRRRLLDDLPAGNVLDAIRTYMQHSSANPR